MNNQPSTEILEGLRSGLTNFIGAVAVSLGPSPDTRQQVIGILIEEALKLSQQENQVCDLYALKPLLRAQIFLFEQRIEIISQLGQSADQPIGRYKRLIAEMESLLDQVKNK